MSHVIGRGRYGRETYPIPGPNVPPIPPLVQTQEVFVSKGGSDATGTGTALNPYLTIARAMASITDNTINKNYAIYVGPGEYADPWGLKPWVGVVGAASPSNGARPNGATLTTITAPPNTIGFDPSWTAASGFGVGFLESLGFTDHQTWDQGTNPGIQPQINAQSCSFNGGASFLGPGNLGFDNVTLINCISYGGYTVRGWQFLWMRACVTLGGTVLVEAGPVGATANTTLLAQFSQLGSIINSTNIVVRWAAPSPAGVTAIARLDNTDNSGIITLDGVHTTFSESSSSTGVINLINGANNYVGHILGEHITIEGTLPSVVPGANAGGGATTTNGSQDTDNAGTITLNTGSAPNPTAGVQASVTYATPYPPGVVPIVVLGRADAQTVGQFYITNQTNTGFDIAASVAPSPSQTYAFPYLAMGHIAP